MTQEALPTSPSSRLAGSVLSSALLRVRVHKSRPTARAMAPRLHPIAAAGHGAPFLRGAVRPVAVRLPAVGVLAHLHPRPVGTSLAQRHGDHQGPQGLGHLRGRPRRIEAPVGVQGESHGLSSQPSIQGVDPGESGSISGPMVRHHVTKSLAQRSSSLGLSVGRPGACERPPLAQPCLEACGRPQRVLPAIDVAGVETRDDPSGPLGHDNYGIPRRRFGGRGRPTPNGRHERQGAPFAEDFAA